MKEIWISSAIALALTSAPSHLAKQVQQMEGGGRYVAEAVPLAQDDKQYILVAFCKISGSRPGDIRRLYPPFASVLIGYPTKTIEWQDESSVTNTFSNTLIDSNNLRYLGVVNRSHVNYDEWSNAKNRYNILISKVLENRWLVTRHPTTAEERATAQELLECTRILYDKPLLPYYQRVGHQLLAWMDR